MDSELKELLKQNLELSRETNELLHKMARAARWGRAFRIAYWVIIIGVTFGVFYYLKDTLEQLLGFYASLLPGGGSAPATEASSPGNMDVFRDLMKRFGY